MRITRKDGDNALRITVLLCLFLGGCATHQRPVERHASPPARLYEVSIKVDNKLIAQPKLVVPSGQSGNLEVPGTTINNGYSVLVQKDGTLRTKVVLVEQGSIIASPEILLKPNSKEVLELASYKRRITIAVTNTAQDASL